MEDVAKSIGISSARKRLIKRHSGNSFRAYADRAQTPGFAFLGNIALTELPCTKKKPHHEFKMYHHW